MHLYDWLVGHFGVEIAAEDVKRIFEYPYSSAPKFITLSSTLAILNIIELSYITPKFRCLSISINTTECRSIKPQLRVRKRNDHTQPSLIEPLERCLILPMSKSEEGQLPLKESNLYIFM
jgi:hypothetical protein